MRATVSGDDALIRKLRHLSTNGQRKAVRSGINRGITVISQEIRRHIPPSKKSIRKALGRKNLKLTKKETSGAKVGLGVGKRKPPPARGPKKPGVGISKQNIHWWILGTGPRRTKSGRYTGRMPAAVEQPVKAGTQAARSRAISEIRQTVLRKIEEEAKKG